MMMKGREIAIGYMEEKSTAECCISQVADMSAVYRFVDLSFLVDIE